MLPFLKKILLFPVFIFIAANIAVSNSQSYDDFVELGIIETDYSDFVDIANTENGYDRSVGGKIIKAYATCKVGNDGKCIRNENQSEEDYFENKEDQYIVYDDSGQPGDGINVVHKNEQIPLKRSPDNISFQDLEDTIGFPIEGQFLAYDPDDQEDVVCLIDIINYNKFNPSKYVRFCFDIDESEGIKDRYKNASAAAVLFGVDSNNYSDQFFNYSHSFESNIPIILNNDITNFVVVDFYGKSKKYPLFRNSNNLYILDHLKINFDKYKDNEPVDLSKLGNFVQAYDNTGIVNVDGREDTDAILDVTKDKYVVKLTNLISQENPVLDIDFGGRTILMNSYTDTNFFKNGNNNKIIGLDIARDYFLFDGSKKEINIRNLRVVLPNDFDPENIGRYLLLRYRNSSAEDSATLSIISEIQQVQPITASKIQEINDKIKDSVSPCDVIKDYYNAQIEREAELKVAEKDQKDAQNDFAFRDSDLESAKIKLEKAQDNAEKANFAKDQANVVLNDTIALEKISKEALDKAIEVAEKTANEADPKKNTEKIAADEALAQAMINYNNDVNNTTIAQNNFDIAQKNAENANQELFNAKQVFDDAKVVADKTKSDLDAARIKFAEAEKNLLSVQDPGFIISEALKKAEEELQADQAKEIDDILSKIYNGSLEINKIEDAIVKLDKEVGILKQDLEKKSNDLKAASANIDKYSKEYDAVILEIKELEGKLAEINVKLQEYQANYSSSGTPESEALLDQVKADKVLIDKSIQDAIIRAEILNNGKNDSVINEKEAKESIGKIQTELDKVLENININKDKEESLQNDISNERENVAKAIAKNKDLIDANKLLRDTEDRLESKYEELFNISPNLNISNSEFIGPRYSTDIFIDAPKSVVSNTSNINGLLYYTNSTGGSGDLSLINYEGGGVLFFDPSIFIQSNKRSILRISESKFRSESDAQITFDGCGNIEISRSDIGSDILLRPFNDICDIDLNVSDSELINSIRLSSIKDFGSDTNKDNYIISTYRVSLENSVFAHRIILDSNSKDKKKVELNFDNVQWYSSDNIFIDEVGYNSEKSFYLLFNIKSGGLDINLNPNARNGEVVYDSDLIINGLYEDKNNSNNLGLCLDCRLKITEKGTAIFNGLLQINNLNLQLDNESKLKVVGNLVLDNNSKITFDLSGSNDSLKIDVTDSIIINSLDQIGISSIGNKFTDKVLIIKAGKIIDVHDSVTTQSVRVNRDLAKPEKIVINKVRIGNDIYNITLDDTKKEIFIEFSNEVEPGPLPPLPPGPLPPLPPGPLPPPVPGDKFDLKSSIIPYLATEDNLFKFDDRYISCAKEYIRSAWRPYTGAKIIGGKFDNNKFIGYDVFVGAALYLENNWNFIGVVKGKQFLSRDKSENIYIGSNIYLGARYNNGFISYDTSLSGGVGVKNKLSIKDLSNVKKDDVIYNTFVINRLRASFYPIESISVVPEISLNASFFNNSVSKSNFGLNSLIGIGLNKEVQFSNGSNILLKLFLGVNVDEYLLSGSKKFVSINPIDDKKVNYVFSAGFDFIRVFNILNINLNYKGKYLHSSLYSNELSLSLELDNYYGIYD